MNLRTAIEAGRARLTAAGIGNFEAGRDAALLARDVLGYDRASMYVHHEDPVTGDFFAAFDALIDRRARREPVAYIRGEQEFWNRDYAVNGAVLIPRPETELIIEELLERLPIDLPSLPRRVADIGTGSGCLAITAAAERPNLQVVATDISRPALDVARANAGRHGVLDRVTFVEGAYLDGVAGAFDFILSNPPYVTEAEYAALAPEVRDYEPPSALIAGADGLRDIRQVLEIASTRLVPGGTALIEIGWQQADAVVDLVAGIRSLLIAEIANDLQNIPRVVVVERKITDL